MKRSTRRTRGQAMVEFALIAPLFLPASLLDHRVRARRLLHPDAQQCRPRGSTLRDRPRRARLADRLRVGALSGDPDLPERDRVRSQRRQGGRGDQDRGVAIIDSTANAFAVDVRWCANDGNIADCPGTRGDGDNGRNQTVKVTITYTFQPMLAGVVPLPTFTMTGGSTLVVNN